MKTTPKHFIFFEKSVRKLVKLFGLVSYEVYIDHDKIEGSTFAQTHADLENRQAIITLNTDSNDLEKISKRKIYNAAFHEVMEVLFWKLESYVSPHLKKEAREEVHAIIQTIINFVDELENAENKRRKK